MAVLTKTINKIIFFDWEGKNSSIEPELNIISNPIVGISRGCNITDKVFAKVLFIFYSSFLNRATGIFNCSRYLATVLRAIL